MLYNLRTEAGRDRAFSRLQSLAKAGAVVEIADKTIRSPQQNRYLHAIIGYIAVKYGCSAEYCKREFFKTAANSNIFKVERVANNGARYYDLRSTSDLSREEISQAIDNFRAWAMDYIGEYIPRADEYMAVNEMELIIQRETRGL